MSRAAVQPILEAIPAARQEDARHYGVHPYFTRRPANVVREYLKRYSEPGDTVLDPFGGTGVTAIEAFLLGRHAIQNDLNPFANFIARNIADTTLPSLGPLREAFARIEEACAERLKKFERDESVAKKALETCRCRRTSAFRKTPMPSSISKCSRRGNWPDWRCSSRRLTAKRRASRVTCCCWRGRRPSRN